MKITVNPVNVVENPKNEVTSDKVFQARKIKDGDRYLFHADGIFSEKIFGKFSKCYCGKLTKPGYCGSCGCRVISKRNVPNFYMKFNFDLPNHIINYEDYDKELFSDLMSCRGFLYEGKYVEFNLKKEDLSIYDETKVLYGKDAIMSFAPIDNSSEEALEKSMLARNKLEAWYNNNTHRIVSIPHTSFRQITFQGDNYFLGSLNVLYINMLKLAKKYDYNKKNSTLTVFNEINLRYLVNKDIEKLYAELFQILAKNNRNVIDNELKGQPETGMIRTVMTNNFGLDEDDIKLGYYFIPTLYPKFYREYTDENGYTDIDAINQRLKDEKYLVLFNRQPTIGQKSIISMRPIFSKLDSEIFVIQANPIIYDGLAADVDGDALNVIALYSKAACKEAEKLLPSRNYVEGSNGGIRNCILEELEYVNTLIGE